MDFVGLTIEILKVLAAFVGSYGLAIVVLTLIVRAALWPLNASQQRSMRMMQTLQPKLKAIQDRYKSNPQVMQQKMMEFYKEHNFNPMGGCLPLLIQMPIFILLYSALMNPAFIQVAGNSKFLFINRLDTTLRASAGISNDGVMGTSKYDTFIPGKVAKVYLPDEVLENVKITKPKNALEIQGDITPGENIDFKMSLDHLDLKFSQLDKIEKAEITITDINPKYFLMENVARMKQDDMDFITGLMGVKPIRINSKLVSAQLRDRLYWTNIPNVTIPQDKGMKLQDILTSGYADREKARALLVSDSRPLTTKERMIHRYRSTGFTTLVWEQYGNDESVRYMNQTELERCQTVPEGYTECLTRNEAADVLGDGWTVDVIAHIFAGL